MLSFKQFLKEAPIIEPRIEKDISKPYVGHPEDENKRITLGMIGKYPVKTLPYHGTWNAFTLHHPKTGRITFTVSGRQEGNKLFVTQLNRTTGSPIKGHEFYSNLIKNHNVHLHSDTVLSPGGAHVWKQLHGTDGIKTQAYNIDNQKYTNLDKTKPIPEEMFNNDRIRFAAKKD